MSKSISQNLVDDQQPSFLVSFVNFFVDDEVAKADLERIWEGNADRLANVDPDMNIYNIAYPEGFEHLSEKKQVTKAIALFEARKYAVIKQAYYNMMFNRSFVFIFSAVIFYYGSKSFFKIFSQSLLHAIPGSIGKILRGWVGIESTNDNVLGPFSWLWWIIAQYKFDAETRMRKYHQLEYTEPDTKQPEKRQMELAIERFPIMLIGVPGIGKTEFVKRVAKALDLPISELRLEGGLAALFGVPERTPSKVALSLIAGAGPAGKENYENGILLIDEAGRMLHNVATENFFLKFVDPTHSTHPDLFFNAKIRLPMFIFCTDNYPIKDVAIADRFIEIKFPLVEQKNKFNIARNIFVPKKITQYSSLPYAIALEDLTEEDYAEMETMIRWQEKQEEAEESGSLRPAQRAVNLFVEKKIRDRYLEMMGEGEDEPAEQEAHEEGLAEGLDDDL